MVFYSLSRAGNAPRVAFLAIFLLLAISLADVVPLGFRFRCDSLRFAAIRCDSLRFASRICLIPAGCQIFGSSVFAFMYSAWGKEGDDGSRQT